MKGFLVTLALALPLSAAEKQSDIVVYGGTSGGIIAAIQAAKSERSVVLVSPTPYLGGLTTSALGWTDLGSDAILGGLSRDFYTTRNPRHGLGKNVRSLPTRDKVRLP
jgi:hypothetical protein